MTGTKWRAVSVPTQKTSGDLPRADGLTASPGRTGAEPSGIPGRSLGGSPAGRRPSTALVLDGLTFSAASTPDDPALDLTSVLDIRVDVQMADWTPAAISTFVGKWSTTDNQRSYVFGVSTAGVPRLQVSADGTAATTILATTGPTISDGQRLALRVIYVANDGGGNRVTNFYTAPTIAGPWTQLGTTVTTAGAVAPFSGTAAVEVGSNSNGTLQLMTGLVFGVEIRSAIDGTVVTSPNFSSLSARQPSFDDDQRRPWTIGGSALIGVV